ncbi:hypothetical protein Tco_1268549 [Tanacetum coccineum]
MTAMAHQYQGTDKEDTIVHTGCVLGLPNVDTWDDILNKFGMRTPGRCADNWMNDLAVVEKPIPKVIFKSYILIKRRMLGLANVETWDNIVKKYGMRTPGRCADKSKGKRKIPVTGCVLGLANVTIWDEIVKKIGLKDFYQTVLSSALAIFAWMLALALSLLDPIQGTHYCRWHLRFDCFSSYCRMINLSLFYIYLSSLTSFSSVETLCKTELSASDEGTEASETLVAGSEGVTGGVVIGVVGRGVVGSGVIRGVGVVAVFLRWMNELNKYIK